MLALKRRSCPLSVAWLPVFARARGRAAEGAAWQSALLEPNGVRRDAAAKSLAQPLDHMHGHVLLNAPVGACVNKTVDCYSEGYTHTKAYYTKCTNRARVALAPRCIGTT